MNGRPLHGNPTFHHTLSKDANFNHIDNIFYVSNLYQTPPVDFACDVRINICHKSKFDANSVSGCDLKYFLFLHKNLLGWNYRVLNNNRVTELFSIAIGQLRMVRIVRNVHNDRHSARHPEASQNAYHCERCVQSESSDMCYQLKPMGLVTLSLLTTL